MGTYIALLESEEHWRAISRKQAVFRSVLVHSLVWTSLLWVGARCTVPQLRDAGSVLIEFHGQQYNLASALAPGKMGNSTPVASARKVQSSRRPSVVAKTPNVVSRRAVRVKAVPSKQPAVQPSVGGALVHLGKPIATAPTPTPKPGPSGAIEHKPSVTTDIEFVMPSSAGVQASLNSGAVVPRASELKSTFAELDAKACTLFMQGEFISTDNPEIAGKFYSEALAVMQEAVPILKKEIGENRNEVAFATMNLGRCYDRMGDYEMAVECLRQAAQLDESLNGADSLSRAVTNTCLADSLKKLRRYEEAKEALLKSLMVYEKQYGVDSAEVGLTHSRLMDLESLSEQSATRKLVFESLGAFNLRREDKILEATDSNKVVSPNELINLYYVPASRTNPLYLAPSFEGWFVRKKMIFQE
jgi:hypothetical protein